LTLGLEALKQRASVELLRELESYRQELLQERERQANIKEKYGVRSLEHLVVELDGDLIRLQERRDAGENVDLVIHNKQEQKKNYERSLENLRRSLEQDRTLTLSTPRFLGAVAVVPQRIQADEMVSDPQIEQVGMRVTMDYERRQGRVPEDVAASNRRQGKRLAHSERMVQGAALRARLLPVRRPRRGIRSAAVHHT